MSFEKVLFKFQDQKVAGLLMALRISLSRADAVRVAREMLVSYVKSAFMIKGWLLILRF